MAKPVMLIIDDVKMNREMLKQYFLNDYDFLEADDGDIGLAIIETKHVDIVMLDLIMPSLNGYEVLTRIKNSEHADLPTIVMTAYTDGQSEALAMEMGADDFITKPYNPIVVQCRVRNVMARRERDAKDLQVREMTHTLEHDSLTGIYNQETFIRKAEKLLQEQEHGDWQLSYWDIHSFKVINDLFGVITGNAILKAAAGYLQHVSKTSGGMCCRMGADRFALLLPEGAPDMEALIHGMDQELQNIEVTANITFFVGVYTIANARLPVDRMLDRARMAMKSTHGNYIKRYAVYDDAMRNQLIEEQLLVKETEIAVQQDQFCVYYQPVYDLHTREVVSAEALVRWHHPEKGMVPPGMFLPVFERNGFIMRLDYIIWEKVCQFLAWEKRFLPQVTPVSVNVSRLDFFNRGLIDDLCGLVREYGLEPRMLKLEITESAYMDHPAQIQNITQQFRDKGFIILMDDFGTGYSSLNMLKNLPVDTLKVDMAFVREIEQDQTARILMRDIVRIAKDLGISTIIEGVETENQLRYLASIGCRDIQGYYFSKPLPTEAFCKLLQGA